MRKKILVLLFFAGFGFLAYGQPADDKSQLEKERQEIQRELNEIQGMYNKVKGQTKQTLGQLNMLNRKINLQEQYIGTISKELRSIDDDIYLSEIEIYRLRKQLDTLKAQYARTVVYAYKNRSNYDYLNFIFSASSFNDAVKRIAYLKSYRTYREKQVKTILETQELIAQRKKQQLVRKDQKNVALQSQTKQVQELAVQKKEKDAVVSQLKSKEKELQGQIATKKKRDRDLQNAITAIVRREIEAAKAKAKAEAEAKRKADELAEKKNPEKAPVTATNPTTNPTTSPVTTAKRNEPAKRPDSYLDFTAKDVALNSSFQANKARLPWPVDNGVVTLRFGNNKIENTLLTFDNPGITIATPSAGVAVKAVFDGEVSGVYNLGDGMAITIRHGKYFTTYSNLSGVTVSKGAAVKTGQQIGRAGKDDDGNGGQIDFILMIETRNVDPLPWLRR
ncbi:MAG TPA: peptidoglycan DD-metalloendopeptidase family protein [Chitinophagaceae bacterium]|nr:peptidoglycan DD-metalloendopeptidase family protein [Chitinophagaceae bacterium]HQV86247.1 peptidoglycan DD-metalloendopeptidase family protein [Chitinophagaceae bacterium]HQX72866.1 peptidoglycan DD-metalloendopeptidase family protein [Chitinophagaceae bacterium]HQZ74278.1 peptidoglycan DD-metalloendopeptidase family protein [Chitinophagaceae bacterium]